MKMVQIPSKKWVKYLVSIFGICNIPSRQKRDDIESLDLDFETKINFLEYTGCFETLAPLHRKIQPADFHGVCFKSYLFINVSRMQKMSPVRYPYVKNKPKP